MVMALKRAVILKNYYMLNGLASIIHKKIHQIFREDEKLNLENFVKKL